MQVRIKQFVQVEVKSSGIEFEVRSPDGQKQLGDCILTMTGLVWCNGKTKKENGVKISWQDFMQIMGSESAKKAALSAAKKD